jgi:hypothetical protein
MTRLPRDYQVLTDSDSIDDVCVYAPSMKGKDHALTVYVPVPDDPCDLERMAEEAARRLNAAPEPDVNPAVSVDLSQAVAFVCAMLDFTGDGTRMSPHMITHLDAALGRRQMPYADTVENWSGAERPEPYFGSVNLLIDYLHAVVHALQAHREALRP